MDGCPRLSLALCLGMTMFSTGAMAQAGDPPAAVSIYAKVRDFKEANASDPANTHPHFNTYNACSAQEAGSPTAQDNLDVAQPSDGLAYPGDNRGPQLRTDMPDDLARCFVPMDRFSDWFQDRGPDVNRAFLIDIRFRRDAATGMYVHQSSAFFPVDSGSPYPEVPAHRSGSLRASAERDSRGRQGSVHAQLRFHHGVPYPHRLRGGRIPPDGILQGDDDIWAYINGIKVADLGGVHQTQMISVDMDSLAGAIGLTDGTDYPLDFYFAERHTASSSFKIAANLNPGSVSVRPFAGRGRSPAVKLAAGTTVEVFDRGGRLVRSLRTTGEAAADRLWDGKDSSGRPVASGLYVWRAKTNSTPALTGWVTNGDRFD